MADEQAAGAQEQPQQQFAMQRIYNKDVSFESPGTPGIFTKTWQPKVNVDLNTRSTPSGRRHVPSKPVTGSRS